MQVILDLTTLEKRGKFKALDGLVRVYHGKRGVHLVILYLVVGQWRVPWSFRLYRGKDTSSPAQLGLKLVRGLPKALTQHFEVLALVDITFGNIAFVEGVRKLKHHVIAGVRYDRRLADGRWVGQLYKRGQHLRLVGLKFPVSAKELTSEFIIYLYLLHPYIFGTTSNSIFADASNRHSLKRELL